MVRKQRTATTPVKLVVAGVVLYEFVALLNYSWRSNEAINQSYFNRCPAGTGRLPTNGRSYSLPAIVS